MMPAEALRDREELRNHQLIVYNDAKAKMVSGHQVDQAFPFLAGGLRLLRWPKSRSCDMIATISALRSTLSS